MFADPLALRLEPTACKTVMALSMADRPPAIDVLYPESAPSISTGSGTQPRSLRHSALLRLRCRFARFRRFYLTIPHGYCPSEMWAFHGARLAVGMAREGYDLQLTPYDERGGVRSSTRPGSTTRWSPQRTSQASHFRAYS